MISIKYETEVVEIGDQALEFLNENMLIMFKAGAPVELRELSVVHKVKTALRECPVVGNKFSIGNSIYEITSVGDVACKNLEQLGHVTLKFDGAVDAELPGNIHLTPSKMPEIKVGININIYNINENVSYY